MSHIKVGDLVAVVRPSPCCGNANSVGKIFKVKATGLIIVPVCKWCQRIGDEPLMAASKGVGVIQFGRLKKIEPLGEDDALQQSSEHLLETFGG